MASETLQIILQLITGQYKKEAREVASATGRIGASATSAVNGGVTALNKGMNALKGAFAAIGVTRLIGEFQEMARAAAEDAEAQEILAGALRTNTGATDGQIAANERWISSMQIATRTADNDLRQAITDLTVAGRGLEEAQTDVGIAIDIAASKGIELSAVMKALVRAQATGSTAGLGRLGIETKNAAGEMLNYDEVLQNAAETMGGTAARAAGTLAGALERGAIAVREAKEEAGSNFLPVLVSVTDQFNELVVAALGGNRELTHLQSVFNSLIVSGIDPFADAVGSAGFVLTELADQFEFAGGIDVSTFETLVMMLGLTNEQVLELRRNFIQNGAAVVDSDEKLQNLIGVLDSYVGVADPAVLATRRFQAAQEDGAGATRDYTDALQAQRDLLREMTDPFFALLAASERLADANRNLNEIMAEGDTTSMEYKGAIADLLQAQLDYNFAQAEAVATGESAIGVFDSLAAQAGINEGLFLSWAQAVDTLAGSIANLPATVGGRPTVTSGSRNQPQGFAEGGVVPGPRGAPRLILAHGGETVVPTHQSGMALPSGWNRPNVAITIPSTGYPVLDAQLATITATVVTMVEVQN